MNEFSSLAQTVLKQKYLWPGETWDQLAERVAGNVLWAIGIEHGHPIMLEVTRLIRERKFIPAGRYLYAAGRPFKQTQNCVALNVTDSREGWSSLLHKSSMALMTGAGIGSEYSLLRPSGAVINKTGGVASGPLALIHMVNEVGRYIQQGGSRRAAVLAQLLWSHANIHDFIRAKNWSEEVRRLKAENFNFPAALDGTNISVRIDDEFIAAMEAGSAHAIGVFNSAIRQMCMTGEPGFTINLGERKTSIYTNACGEFRSDLPDTVCNLGSINLARVSDISEFSKVVELASIFLYAGTFYSDVPYQAIDDMRAQRRHIGLGFMGIHEWLLQRGYRYGETPAELTNWMEIYAGNIDAVVPYARKLGAVIPAAGRAVAPSGSISIVGKFLPLH